MTGQIQALPEEIIRQITAGEVIDSIAAVVRELVENALDAGATRLVIEVDPLQWQVIVTDNGQGMNCQDLERAALSHTTSKIRVLDDVWQIQSLGFRGEALHSLALLADLEIHSASQETQEGWLARYHPDGSVKDLMPVAIATGTIVSVSQLFKNWPSRRASLPSIQKQLKAVQGVIQAAALAHPWVTWQVKRRSQPWFNLWPGSGTADLLPQMIRRLDRRDLHSLIWPLANPTADSTILSVSEGEPAIGQLEVVMGLPDRTHRQRPDWVKVAVNRRMVKVPDLEQTILSAFARTLPRDRFPLCWAHFLIPGQFVDWNRQPAKTEIYLQYLETWQRSLATAIQQIQSHSLVQVTEAASNQRLKQMLKVSESTGSYRSSPILGAGFGSNQIRDFIDPPELESSQSQIPDSDLVTQQLVTLELRAIAQLRKTYIVVEHPAGLWLVEQHIAHERVLYEQLCDRWLMVPLATPIVLNHLSVEQRSQLSRIGIDCESFGDQTWAVRSAPASLAERSDCYDALWELSLGGDLQTAQVATACRSAIRNGTELSLSEMQTLLNQWQRTANPRTCPHGRPISLVLPESALARYFRRHWVIGKSHGI